MILHVLVLMQWVLQRVGALSRLQRLYGFGPNHFSLWRDDKEHFHTWFCNAPGNTKSATLSSKQCMTAWRRKKVWYNTVWNGRHLLVRSYSLRPSLLLVAECLLLLLHSQAFRSNIWIASSCSPLHAVNALITLSLGKPMSDNKATCSRGKVEKEDCSMFVIN